ncbi:fam-l protein [Plasmodium malariae]|uniref:Fam-l protein n=1 Tax=Plasmodium malariae TaxID=5858 RepID=A0A1D3JIC5_PLAMA|nr:fam-l protein [Plasmodium malariae]SBT86066.1 fam-l protein [Plasmodium malariae]
MKQKMKLFFLIEISTFVLLSLICYFYKDVNIFSKYLDENYKLDSKLNGTFRLMAKCKRDKNLCIVELKNETPNNELNEKKYISNNKKGATGTTMQPNGSSLNKVGWNKHANKNKCYIFETKKYSRLEKKIFKELDYEDFLKNNRTISNKIYKKIIRKKLASQLAPTLIFFILLSLSFVLDYCGSYGLVWGLVDILNSFSRGWSQNINSYLGGSFLNSLLEYKISNGSKGPYYTLPLLFNLFYVIPFIIYCIIIISRIVYYHKKVKKYEKIKYRKR